MLAARILLPLYLAVVGWVTLAPVPWRTRTNETEFGVLGVRTWLDPSTWQNGSIWEFGANVVMFVPVGILIRMAWPRAHGALVIVGAVAIAGAIEVLQLPIDRVSDPRDLVANTLGALAGIAVGTLLLLPGRMREQRDGRQRNGRQRDGRQRARERVSAR